MIASKYPSVQRQLTIGKQGEEILDLYFGRNYYISPATKDQENQQGIDRVLTNKSNGQKLTIEYKFDRVAAKTRNAFIELLGNVEEHRQGWAYKCQADYIAYLVGEEAIFLFRPSSLKSNLNMWAEACNLKIVERRFCGNWWSTRGLLLPLRILATISYVFPVNLKELEANAIAASWSS